MMTDATGSIMPRIVSASVPFMPRIAGNRILRLAALLGFGLMVGACTKCDVPDWIHTTPHACHGDAQPQ